jgi:myosin heavy subunit
MARPQEDLKYDSSAKVSSRGTAILGKLTGPCADCVNPTRNGRKYSNELWEKVFKDPLVKEQFNNGGIFGELNHPADRDEVDLTQVCVCMSEPPKKNDKGELIASWDILNTPNGRILKTLCDYGYKLGISSRGSGEVETDFDGNESVDPDSYQLNAWDIVLIPAVKTARLDYVTEGLSTKKTLKQALVESLNSANASDRKIMEDTLNNLDIHLTESDKDEYCVEYTYTYETDDVRDTFLGHVVVKANNEQEALEKAEKHVNSIEYQNAHVNEYSPRNFKISDQHYINSDVVENIKAVDNNEAMVEELQSSIKQNQELQNQIINLQEKLSVCYAKENSQQEEITKLRTVIQRLSEDVRKKEALQNQIRRLNDKLQESNDANTKLKEELVKSNENVKNGKRDYNSLNESVKLREHEVQALKSEITSLNKKIASISKENSDKVANLTESLETLKKDSEQHKTQYSQKLSNANKLVEKYKKIANTAVDKYIESEAIKLGITKEEIKNKLPQSYTFKDIDSICEDLQSYKLSVNNLPFRINENIKAKATESKHESILPARTQLDDEVDNSLLEMAGLK